MNKTSNVSNLLQIFKNFIIDKNNNSNNPIAKTTVRNYVSDTKHFLLWAFKTNPNSKHRNEKDVLMLIKGLDKDLINKYKQELYTKGTPISTIDRRLSSLRHFLYFCIENNWLKDNILDELTNIRTDLKKDEIKDRFIEFLKEKYNFPKNTIKTILNDIDKLLAVSNLN